MSTLRQRTGILALGEFTNSGLTAIIAIALTRLLTKQDFGTYRQVLLAYSILVAFLGSQIAESLLYFLVRAAKKDKPLWLSQTIILSTVAGLAGGALILVLGEAWSSWNGNPDLAELMRVFAFYPLADRLARLVPSALIAADQAGSAASFTVCLGAVKVLSAVVPAALGQPLIVILWTMNACWILVAALGLVWLRLRSGIGWALPQRGTVSEQLLYVTPLLFGSALGATHEQFGQVLASMTMSTTEYADYAVGAVQLPWVGVWIASIATALMPDLVARASTGDTRGLIDLWHRGMRQGALLVFPSIAIAAAVAPDFIRTLYGPQYARATWPFLLFLIGLVPRITNYSVVFRALGATAPMILWTGGGLLINVTVATLLSTIGRGGILGFLAPAIGYVVGYYATVFITLVLMSARTGLPLSALVPFREIAPLACLAALCGALTFFSSWLPIADYFATTPTVLAATRCVVGAAVFTVAFGTVGLLFRVFSATERRAIAGVFQVFRLHGGSGGTSEVPGDLGQRTARRRLPQRTLGPPCPSTRRSWA